MQIPKAIYFLAGLFSLIIPAGAQDIIEAVRKGDIEKVEALLRKDPAILHLKSDFQLTLLQEAVKAGNLPLAKTLVGLGLSVGEQNAYGWTALHFAGEKGDVPLIAWLIEKGAPLNARTIDGQTPFNIASDAGRGDAAAYLASKGADQSPQAFPRSTEAYFGQPEPGVKAEPFALPWLAPRHERYIRTVTFTPDGTEAYWPVIDQSDGLKRWIVESTMKSGVWERPRIAAFSRKGCEDDVPCLAPDGKTLLFLSLRPLGSEEVEDKERIWMTRRDGDRWSEPKPLPPAVNALGTLHQQVSVDVAGNLYFGCDSPKGNGDMDLYVSKYLDGEFRAPVNLGSPLNGPGAEYAPFIAPDGSYLLFNRIANDRSEFLISFRGVEGKWSVPRALTGELFGLSEMDLGEPFITRDGRALIFYGSQGRISTPFWIAASVIDTLRRK